MAKVSADWWKDWADLNRKISETLEGKTPEKNLYNSTKPISTTNISAEKASIRASKPRTTAAKVVATGKTTTTAKPVATATPKKTKLTRSTSGTGNLSAMKAAEKTKLSQKEKTYMKSVREKNVKKPLPSKDPKAIREDYKAPLRKMGSNNPYVKDLLKRLKEKK